MTWGSEGGSRAKDATVKCDAPCRQRIISSQFLGNAPEKCFQLEVDRPMDGVIACKEWKEIESRISGRVIKLGGAPSSD